jgi:16S rRNA A1518/A1519 N6-dimethyltransferase RsmA/KsgA/DIM1 with predicted DNA glycosylase/AP lyase activity
MLTRSLLTLPSAGVLGVEADTRYNGALESVAAASRGRFRWCNADVRDVDEAALVARHYPSVAAWLRDSNRAATFAEMRGKQAAARQRSVKQAQRWGVADAEGCDDEALDAALGRAGADGTAASPLGGRDATSPFEEDTAGAAGSLGAAEASASASSTLWRAVPRIEVVGNLPFDVVGDMLMRFCVDCSRRQNLFRYGRVPFHFFFQKEVAERLIALPTSAQYGRLSVLAQNYFRVHVKQTFLEKTFYPATEVLGALVGLEPRAEPLVAVDGAVLANFLDVVLAPRQRSGTILTALKKCMPPEVALFVLSELRADPVLMPTQFSPPELAQMALLWVRYLEAVGANGGVSADDEPLAPEQHDAAAVARRARANREQAARDAAAALSRDTTTSGSKW